MSTPEFILKALFFVVNSFALCFLVWFVCRTVKHMESKLGETIFFMRLVKSRHDTTYLYMLYRLQEMFIKEEKYEEAAKVKKIIDDEVNNLENEMENEQKNKQKD